MPGSGGGVHLLAQLGDIKAVRSGRRWRWGLVVQLGATVEPTCRSRIEPRSGPGLLKQKILRRIEAIECGSQADRELSSQASRLRPEAIPVAGVGVLLGFAVSRYRRPSGRRSVRWAASSTAASADSRALLAAYTLALDGSCAVADRAAASLNRAAAPFIGWHLVSLAGYRAPQMESVEQLENRRIHATQGLDKKHRSTFGQFFTPQPVARYMASLLEFPPEDEVHLLDPGAGIGSLTAAAAYQANGKRFKATCYELEPGFQNGLKETLASLSGVKATVQKQDFIEHTVLLIAAGERPHYTHAILNPPYKKINTDSHHRMLVRKLGLETSNLYTCFLACTIASCKKGAQVVAIIPRSFMNGLYFKPFRYWLLDRVALTHVHVFDSRDQAFADDDVLQENVILRLVVGAKQGSVEISTSYDSSFTDIRHWTCDFSEVVMPGDEEVFIHIPALEERHINGLPGSTLRELGLDVCTGPVVDFRLRTHLQMQPTKGSVPLLYASHFVNGRLEWPREGRKPNAIMMNDETQRWLMPTGCYVVLRRFSAKEEKRRVVAYLLDKDALPENTVGFENHLNVIHENRHGLSPDVARGLVAYLNSQEVDSYFRSFSGHTQVNATDLRRLRYPKIEKLAEMGKNLRA